VEHHIEEKLRLPHAEEPLQDYQVSRTANGEKLRYSLDDPQDNGMKKADGILLYNLNQHAKSLNAAEHNSGYDGASHQDPDHIGNDKLPVAEAQEVGTQGAGI
jgi:hypothetical protein